MNKAPLESVIHTQICSYLRLQYPNIMFITDLSGIKLTIGQAIKLKTLRSGRAWPDLFIAEPNKEYHGLFLEIKRDSSEIRRKDGSLKTNNQHINEQYNVLNELKSKGYVAVFACGFDEAKRIIDDYLL